MTDTILVIIAVFIFYVGIGLMAYYGILDILLSAKLYSPLWRPFAFTFWPLTLVIAGLVAIGLAVVDWVEEVKEYYTIDEED